MSMEERDGRIEAEISELLCSVRSLSRKNQFIFLATAKGLVTGLKTGK